MEAQENFNLFPLDSGIFPKVLNHLPHSVFAFFDDLKLGYANHQGLLQLLSPPEMVTLLHFVLRGMGEINLFPLMEEVRNGKTVTQEVVNNGGQGQKGYKIQLSQLQHDTSTLFVLFIQGPDAFSEAFFQTQEPEIIDEELLRGVRVLVVDDNEINRLVAINLFRKWNMEVESAIHGKDALDKLLESKFDLVLMDIQMPVMDGMEATQEIRKTLKSDIPIIALSSSPDLEKFLSIGMNACLEKTYQPQEFFRTVQQVLNLPRQTEANQPTKASTEPMSPEMFNLERLKVIAAGDTDFMERMILLFLDQSAENIEKILDAQQSNNLVKLKSVAHKMKPSVNILGIDAVTELLTKIESLDTPAEGADIHRYSEEIVSRLNLVCKELRKWQGG